MTGRGHVWADFRVLSSSRELGQDGKNAGLDATAQKPGSAALHIIHEYLMPRYFKNLRLPLRPMELLRTTNEPTADAFVW